MQKSTNLIEKILIIASALMLEFSMLSFVTEFVCCNPTWFHHEYSSHDEIREWIRVDEAVQVTGKMMDYLYGRIDSLDDVKATFRDSKYSDVQGQYFFNQREKHHLADCRVLFTRSHTIAIVFLVISLISVLFLIKKKKTLDLARIFRNTAILTLVSVVLATIVFALNFDAAYDWIHELLFDNYLWILNPATDNLINLMQTDIIVDTAILILAIWSAITVLCSILAHSYIRRNSINS